MANRYYKRSAVLQVGGFNDDLHVMENLDILWKLEKAGFKEGSGKDIVFFHHRTADRFKTRFILSNAFTYGYHWHKLRHLHPEKTGLSAMPIKAIAFATLVLVSYFVPLTLWILFASMSFWFVSRFYRDKTRVKNCVMHMDSNIEKAAALVFGFFLHILFEIAEEIGKLYGTLSWKRE